MRSSRKPRRRRKEKQKAAGCPEPGEWAEHGAVQRQENHAPHYHATKTKFYAASFLGSLETHKLRTECTRFENENKNRLWVKRIWSVRGRMRGWVFL